MKRILAALLLLVAPGMFSATHSVTILIGPGHTAIPACAAGTCDGTADSTSGIISLQNFSGQVWVTAYCAIGPCTGTVNVKQRSIVNTSLGTNPPMTTLISCTNPDPSTGLCADGGSGLMYVLNVMQLQVQQQNTNTGTFGAILELVTP